MTTRNISRLYARNLNIDNLTAKESYHPADRSYELEVVAAPTHVFGEIHRMKNIKQSLVHDR
ncbi:hypothetical protein D3C77_623790 [compost metagenome]